MDLEALGRDLRAAGRARAVRPVVDPLERCVDQGEHVTGVLLEREVDLPVERGRRRLREMVVACGGDLLDLVVERPRMIVAEVRDRLRHPLALLEERNAELLRIDAHERLSFRPRSGAEADASRRSASAGPSPVSSTILSRPPWPETSATASRGSASASASSRRTASFARPCSGAAATRSLHAPPCPPPTCARPAPRL